MSNQFHVEVKMAEGGNKLSKKEKARLFNKAVHDKGTGNTHCTSPKWSKYLRYGERRFNNEVEGQGLYGLG